LTTHQPEEVALRIRVRGQMPLDLNELLRMSSNQRGATRARRKFQADQRLVMRAQNDLPRTPLEGPFHVRFCRIHGPRKAVDIDNATAGLKTILDGLAEERAILHDGHKQIVEIERVWQAKTTRQSEEGFQLDLVRPGAQPELELVAQSLLAMCERALAEPDENRLRASLRAAVQAARVRSARADL